ncbi:DNA translocase FtsK [Nocardioides jensenii]|uniref:DNA translocase FtsK n=1 Tax=Nocardioides jensenii TaxID=1843 RepID=UPI0008299610|nr:DNA translocase FtsK [Nocardioides jensenii]
MNGVGPAAVGHELLLEAAGLVITTQFGSTSQLQRVLGIGHDKAARVMTELEAHGVVGPRKREGLSRDVLVTPDQLDAVRAQIGGGQ